jgi:hypothetical protein
MGICAHAACMSIVGFANPLIIGLSNVFMPEIGLDVEA